VRLTHSNHPGESRLYFLPTRKVLLLERAKQSP
jgi:hypothetical protein